MDVRYRIGLAGIMVALATLLFTAYPTWRDKNFYWFDSLQYQFDKYACTTRSCQIHVRISNHGFAPEEGVEVQFPNVIVGRNEFVYVSVPYTLSKSANGTVLHLGTLYSNDIVLVALDAKDVKHFDDQHPEFNLRVVSKASLASFAGTVGREDPFAEPAWYLWLERLWLIIVGLLVLGGAYFLFFEPPRARRKRLSEQAALLRKQIEKLEAKIATLPEGEPASPPLGATTKDSRRN